MDSETLKEGHLSNIHFCIQNVTRVLPDYELDPCHGATTLTNI